MRLTEFEDVAWFTDDEDILMFSYHLDSCELWDELNDTHGVPIAYPATLAEARTILEQAGHTIS